MIKLSALSLEQLRKLIGLTGKGMGRDTLEALIRRNLKDVAPGSAEELARQRALKLLRRPAVKNDLARKFRGSKEFGRDVLPPLGKAQDLARRQLAQPKPYLPIKKKQSKGKAALSSVLFGAV